MSYDIHMLVSPCTHCGRYPTEELDLNVTWNVGPMFVRAIEHKKGIRVLNGQSGESCHFLLGRAINNMVESKTEYMKMNPKNGWGSYEGALETLKIIRVWCKNYPDGIIEVT